MLHEQHQEIVVDGLFADIRVRIFKITGGPKSEEWPEGVIFVAVGSPIKDECCYLAGAFTLADIQEQITSLLNDPETNGIFNRMAALLGVKWESYEEDARAISEMQEANVARLMNKAPDTFDADVEDLRKLRLEAVEE